MATLGELVVSLKAETAQFTRAMQDVRKETSRISDGMNAMGKTVRNTVAGYLTFEAAVRALHAVVDATEEAEQAQSRLVAVLKATDHAAGLTADQIGDLANEMQQHTLFDDEQIKNAAAALATFSNVTGDSFRTAIRLGADLSTVFGGDLQDNVVKLGKALDSPLEGIDALSRIGVRFNDTEKETIKNLLEHNRLAEAQAVVIEKVKGKVDGAAEALGDHGLAGAIATAKHAWGEFLEAVGNAGEGDGWMAEWAKRSKERAEFWRKMFLPKDAREKIEDDITDLQEKIAKLQQPGDFGVDQESKVHWIQAYQQQIDVLSRRLAEFDAQQEKTENRTAQGAQATATGETPEHRAARLAAAKKEAEDLRKIKKKYWSQVIADDKAAADAQDAINRWLVDMTERAADDETKARQNAFEEQAKIDDFAQSLRQDAFDKEVARQRDLAEQEQKVWNHAVQNISDDFATVFSETLTGQIKSFKDFCTSILTAWAQTLAQMAGAKLATSLFGGLLGSAVSLPPMVPGVNHNIPNPLDASAAGGGSTTVNVNVGGSNASPSQIAAAVVGALQSRGMAGAVNRRLGG